MSTSDLDVEQRLERAILQLLGERAEGATICPSEAARMVGTAEGWRELMEPARQVAARLADAGRVQVTQGGEVVDASSARGPIRIRAC